MRHDTATINDVRHAERVIRQRISAAPLIRSYALEKELVAEVGRRIINRPEAIVYLDIPFPSTRPNSSN